MRALLHPCPLCNLLLSRLYSCEDVMPNVGSVLILFGRGFDSEQPHRGYLIFAIYVLCLTGPRGYRVAVGDIVLPANQKGHRFSSAVGIRSAHELETTSGGTGWGEGCYVSSAKSAVPYVIYGHG